MAGKAKPRNTFIACLAELNPKTMTYKRQKAQNDAELNCSIAIPNKRTCHIHTITIFRYCYEFRHIILLSSASPNTLLRTCHK